MMALVRIERREDAAVLFFARPPVNAFNLRLIEEFRVRLGELAADVPGAGVVVTGEGPAFSAGVDFREVPGYTTDQRTRMVADINAAITILHGLPTPTVAAVNRHAIGAGFVVMLACDARLATDADAKLGLTEVTAGIPYPACPMEVVNAEIEPSWRRHLVLSGVIISSHGAQVRGLLDDVVAHQELLDRAVELARLRAAAPSYRQVKDQLKHDTLSRMREIVATSRDPMLEHWV
jgi:enoyl-CoA hydratase